MECLFVFKNSREKDALKGTSCDLCRWNMRNQSSHYHDYSHSMLSNCNYIYIHRFFFFLCPGKKCHKGCHKRPDGDYASCHGCRFFMTCAGGKKFDKRQCPPGSFFDNNLKRCEIQSSTCDPAGKRKQY